MATDKTGISAKTIKGNKEGMQAKHPPKTARAV
jgi:hypothetical protein